MAKIKLTNGLVAIVDDNDLKLLSGRKWRVSLRADKTPAAVVCGSSKAKTLVLMHRLILGDRPGYCVDHINGDPLDNRKENLRWCSHAENMKNRKINKNNKTGYKGVWVDGKTGKFKAAVRCDGKKHMLGQFDTAREAYLAYCFTAKRLHGEFARLN